MCAYLLVGLPAEGRCPECGWAYDQNIAVLFGQPLSNAQRGPAMAVSIRGAFYATLLLAVALGGVLWIIAGLAIGLMGACVMGIFGVVAWYGTHWADARRERFQFRISPQGVAMRERVGEVKWTPWETAGALRIDWQPTPTPGWIEVYLADTPKQRQRRRLLNWVPASSLLTSESSPGIAAELDAEAARAWIVTAHTFATQHGGTVDLSPRAVEALDLTTLLPSTPPASAGDSLLTPDS